MLFHRIKVGVAGIPAKALPRGSAPVSTGQLTSFYHGKVPQKKEIELQWPPYPWMIAEGTQGFLNCPSSVGFLTSTDLALLMTVVVVVVTVLAFLLGEAAMTGGEGGDGVELLGWIGDVALEEAEAA